MPTETRKKPDVELARMSRLIKILNDIEDEAELRRTLDFLNSRYDSPKVFRSGLQHVGHVEFLKKDLDSDLNGPSPAPRKIG